MTSNLPTISNGRSIPLDAIPTLSLDAFQNAILAAVAENLRVVALFATPPGESPKHNPSPAPACLNAFSSSPITELPILYLILADDINNQLRLARTLIESDSFPSLTPRCPQVHLFEREIAEQFGLRPTDHPWFKPVRYSHSWTTRDAWQRPRNQPILPAVTDFYQVRGDEVHEVAVGPVHAGIIEPGHFRFQCHGEQVFHLEIALGYQHRGIERAMLAGPTKRSIHYAQTLAGDSSIAHTTTYCQILEALAGCQKTPRAQTIRGIALELERMANHVGDLGALAGDVGFLPTASYCGRIRGDFLNMTALLCGNRFGRSLITPGGAAFDLDPQRIDDLLHRLAAAEKDTAVAVNLLWDTPSVMARFEDTGPLTRQTAIDLGIVGPPARAAGLSRDVRHDQPSGIFRFVHIPVSTCDSGDVFARAFVRWLEIQQSIEFIREQLHALPPGDIRTPLGPLAPNRLAVALNEAWRGECCHVALTDDTGRFARYKIIDPSFHNWAALAHVLRNQQISDFPLCNKSFNLSYCGHDL